MSTTTRPTQSTGTTLAIAILKGDDDRRWLSRVPVSMSDLTYLRDETWLAGMRAGQLPPDLSSLKLAVHTSAKVDRDRLAGFWLELASAPASFRKQFSVKSLDRLAQTEVLRLVREGLLEIDEPYEYFLTTGHGESTPSEPAEIVESHEERSEAFTCKNRSETLLIEELPLEDFVTHSEPLYRGGKPSDDDEAGESRLPVFVASQVWEEGRELARRGGERESAAVWTGRLCRDTRSPEMFLLLDACLEAEHAEEEKFSVTFSDQTWGGVRQRLQTRRRRLNRPQEIIVGSVHGHNFQPEADSHGNRACEACHLLDHCTRTTAVASSDDHLWHRCVFAGQPWAVLLVWGWNARDEEDWRLYGLQNGGLRPRGLRVLKNQPPGT